MKYKILTRQFSVILMMLLSSGCNLPAAATSNIAPIAPSDNSPYFGLPITPQPDGDLCWDTEPWGYFGPATWEEIIKQIPVASGVGWGMGVGDLPGATYLGLNTHRVEAGIPLTFTYHMLYPKTTINIFPISLRFMLILDERQLSGAINQSTTKYVDVVFQPGDDVALTLNLPPLEPGIHDLIVLAILGAEDEPDPVGIIKFADFRITLIAGFESQMLDRRYTVFPKIGSIAKGDPLISLNFTLGDHKDTLEAWVWPETRLAVNPGEILDFNIQAGFQATENGDYPDLPQPEAMQSALLFFLDYEQINYTADSPVLYWEVSNDTAYTDIPVQIVTPKDPGRHDIFVFEINYPGVPVCILRGPPNGLLFSYFLYAGRVAIEVGE